MILNREVLGKGFKFPFRFGGDSLSHDGPEQSKYEVHVIECVRLLLLTKLKSRRYKRNLGNRLHELPFDTYIRSQGLAKELVIDALDQEPRVQFENISSQTDASKTMLYIIVDVYFIATSQKANLVFPFYKGSNEKLSVKEVQIEFE